jgi:hypothetical protein
MFTMQGPPLNSLRFGFPRVRARTSTFAPSAVGMAKYAIHLAGILADWYDGTCHEGHIEAAMTQTMLS